MWNSLSSYVVSAKSVNCWRIDSIISGKIIRLFTIIRAEIYGTRNRSEVTV